LPESRYKYLYERLGDHNFQLLVNALLTDRFTDYLPLPLRQADGGRDGVTRGSARSLVYQVKWSVHGKEKAAIEWLDSAITGEAINLQRLASEGARRYVLVTNIPSTGKAGTGTFDVLNSRLDAHAKAFGFEEMSCLWREAVDGMVDSSPNDLTWKYADMLAGWDLIRYLVSEEDISRHDAGLRRLIRKVAAVQWDEDERVKFSQVDVDREVVADLFIDVNADHLMSADGYGRGAANVPGLLGRSPVGGIAAHLLKPGRREGDRVGTLVRGAPGQGKSTLSQYVSQAHRAAFVRTSLESANLPPVALPLFPLRFDLSDYARWKSGIDVWDVEAEGQQRSGKKKTAPQSTIECFIADLMTHASGGTSVSADQVQELFDLVPSIVVLDGLDEVGRPSVRASVVAAINDFAIRSRSYPIPVQLIVTTRPSMNELPEPSTELFEVLVLNPLQPAQRDQYLRKWSAVRGIKGKDGRALRKTYREKISEPYLDELASNPMQLTILLDLLHKHGEATPTQRTALYDSYVELLLAREANKHPESVRNHQLELREIIPFLGWHLHAHTEADRDNSKMTIADLKASIRHFQRTYCNRESIVDELFEAASDRLWTLTSKVQGSYEFEVLSLREYFAARFLYRYAGEDTKAFDRLAVFRELLRRPYWLNTARFYGGNAEVGVVSELADGIVDELSERPPPQSVVAGWTLLTDGVFTSRPRRARDVLFSLCADAHLSDLTSALSRGEITPLPEVPQPAGGGPDPSWTRLTELIAANPGHDDTHLRVVVLRELLNLRREFASWWGERIRNVLTNLEVVDAWLELAAVCEAAAGQVLDLNGLDLSRPLVAQRVLDTGLVPLPGSQFEADLLQAVFNGLCPNVSSVRSLPARIAVAFAPESFFTDSLSGFPDVTREALRRRQEAVKHLRTERPELAAAASQRRFKAGHKGSTFPWANVAAALFEALGPCWLTLQTAILGAASPMNLGLQRRPGRTAFGPHCHPAALLELTRSNAAAAEWWRAQRLALSTDGDLAVWSLALWCVATPGVVIEMFPEWEEVVMDLPEVRRRPAIDGALRCSAHGWVQQLPSALWSTHDQITALLTFRNPLVAQPEVVGTVTRRTTPAPQPPLIEVAREQAWFKVDSVGTYR
jgi:hypothetical protein